MTRPRTAVVARVASLALALVVVAGAAAPALAASTSVTVDAALPDQTRTDEVTFTFTADANATVTATETIERADGSVAFEFDSWEATTGSGSGSDSSWSVTAGREYEVTYAATVTGAVDEGTYSGTAEVSGGGAGVSERLSVSVDVLRPEFGSVDPGESQLLFDDAEAGSQSTEVDVSVSNDGAGAMVLSEVRFSGVPDGFAVETAAVPDVIEGNGEGRVSLDVSADSGVAAGTYEFTATMADNLGNSRDVAVSVDVVKPPVASVSDDEVDVGDVVVGSSESATITVNEVGGNAGIDGMNVNVIGGEADGSVSFDGLDSVSTGAGGSDDAGVTVSVSDDANQHDRLEWDVRVTPDDENAQPYTFTVTGRAIYPATLGGVEVSDLTVPFDEPRSERSSFERTTEIGVENTGDLEMSVVGVSASVRGNREAVTASVRNAPSTVAGQSTGTATLVVEADTSAEEGTHYVDVTVETEEAGTETVTREVSVTQEPSLGVRSNASFGEVTVTENRTLTVEVAERLGYESIEGLTVERVDGPDTWLSVVRRPSGTLPAGETESFVVALRFDPSAELYNQYRWRFRASGEGVDTRTITVTARPKPYSFDQVTEPLGEYESDGGWRADTATPMNGMLLALEDRFRGANETGTDDAALSNGLAAGRATLLFVDSLETARTARENGSYATAQRALVRAAVARDLMADYVASTEGEELRSTARPGVDAAAAAFNRTARAQRQHYREVVEANESVIDTAQANRALMRLAEHTGDDRAVDRYRAAYETASTRYRSLIEEASAESAAADAGYARYRANATVVLAGYPLVLNPARADATLTRIDRIDAGYADSARTFARAGATTEANAVRRRAGDVRSRLTVSRYALFGSVGLYGLVVVFVLLRVVSGTYAYVRDAGAATSGDFLVG